MIETVMIGWMDIYDFTPVFSIEALVPTILTSLAFNLGVFDLASVGFYCICCIV